MVFTGRGRFRGGQVFLLLMIIISAAISSVAAREDDVVVPSTAAEVHHHTIRRALAIQNPSATKINGALLPSFSCMRLLLLLIL